MAPQQALSLSQRHAASIVPIQRCTPLCLCAELPTLRPASQPWPSPACVLLQTGDDSDTALSLAMCDLLLGDTDSALRLLEEDERTAQQQLQQQQQALEAAAAKRGKGRGAAAAAAVAAAAAETAGEQGGQQAFGGWVLSCCVLAGGAGKLRET